MSNRTAVSVSLEQRDELEAWLRRQTIPAGLAKRARAILLLSEGKHVSETARLVGLQRRHLYKWIERFREQGVSGLHDGQRSGRPPVFSPRSRDAGSQARLRAAG
jgi:transposase-like protein